MDLITHTLMSCGVMRAAVPEKKWRANLSLTCITAGILPDMDFWLFFVGEEMYGRYHRTLTHTIWFIFGIAFFSAFISYKLTEIKKLSKFGWLIGDNLRADLSEYAHPPFFWFFITGIISVMTHWLGDMITAYGNLMPLYPLNKYDMSLSLVNSFDWVIFSTTLVWFAFIRKLNYPRKKEIAITSIYFGIIILYLIIRFLSGARGYI